MTVTDDVIRDLLPLYASGEASADTRALVDEWISRAPGRARELEALAEDSLRTASAPTTLAPERALLERTRQLLRRRTGFLAAAFLASTIPFSLVAGPDGIRFLLIRDAPWMGWPILGCAPLLWTAFLLTARRLRVSGL
jgi:anti-sigma factor RsiW